MTASQEIKQEYQMSSLNKSLTPFSISHTKKGMCFFYFYHIHPYDFHFFLANKESTYFQVSHTLIKFYLDISSKVQRSQSASNLPLQLNEFIDLRKTASTVIQLTVGTIKPFKMERKI